MHHFVFLSYFQMQRRDETKGVVGSSGVQWFAFTSKERFHGGSSFSFENGFRSACIGFFYKEFDLDLFLECDILNFCRWLLLDSFCAFWS